MQSPFRVSICGGGIGGLTLALVISKYGTPLVEIFEAGPTITTIGAGIGFFGRTMDIMKELGLYDELAAMAIEPPQENTGPSFRKSDQQDGYHWFSKNLECGVLTVHRKDLIDFLLRKLPAPCKVQTNKRLEFYDVHSETGKITLHFSDGSRSVTDVLVGADGIHSATRKTMYQRLASTIQDNDSRKKFLEFIDPVWTGTLVYRSLVPTAKFLRESPGINPPDGLTIYLGKSKHIVTYPISQGRLLNVVVFCHNRDAFGTPYKGRWVMDVSEKEIMDQFEDWEVGAKALTKCVENPSRWALHSLRPLPHYVDGRVVLLGDAAHAMEPHFGAGAGQAMEDAFVLGRLLTHKLTHRENIIDALKTYEEIRLPFANSIVQQSQNIGRYYGLQRVSTDGPMPADGDDEELDHVRKAIENGWEWQSKSAWVWGDVEERWRMKCSPRAVL